MTRGVYATVCAAPVDLIKTLMPSVIHGCAYGQATVRALLHHAWLRTARASRMISSMPAFVCIAACA
jgi:hypothetical protein